MKKVISVLLAMLLSFSAFAVCTSAAGGEFQTLYVNFEVYEETLRIVPLEGYSQYVLPGEDFKFTIETDDNYTDLFVIVQVDFDVITPDENGVYTISDISQDHTIKAYLSLEEEESNIYASIIVLFRSIIEWIINTINSLLNFAAPV